MNFDTGAVYVFVRSGTTWTQEAYVKASNTGFDDQFGGQTAVICDGTTLVVGATDEESSSIGINGNQLSSTAVDSGAAYIFVRNGTVWRQSQYVKASNTASLQLFGSSLALSSDGTLLVSGARRESSGSAEISDFTSIDASSSDSGAVYLYNLSESIVVSDISTDPPDPVTSEPAAGLFDLTGGVVAGALILVFTPFIMAGIVILALKANRTKKRRSEMANSGGGGSSGRVTGKAVRVGRIILAVRILIACCALAGIGLVAYGIYDYVDFVDSNASYDTLLTQARGRMNKVSLDSQADCKVSDEEWYAGKNPCGCAVVSGRWACSVSANTSSGLQDCNIDTSELCRCNRNALINPDTLLITPAWSCEKIAPLAENTTTDGVDLGLRLVPPNSLGVWSQHSALRGLAGEADGFVLLHAEPGADVGVITSMLLASLIVDAIGLGVLVISIGLAIVYFFLGRQQDADKVNCLGKKVRVFTVLELGLLGLGLALFGGVLLAAFAANPVQNAPRVSVQRFGVNSDLRNIHQNRTSVVSSRGSS
jgi:hypothetical protein